MVNLVRLFRHYQTNNNVLDTLPCPHTRLIATSKVGYAMLITKEKLWIISDDAAENRDNTVHYQVLLCIAMVTAKVTISCHSVSIQSSSSFLDYSSAYLFKFSHPFPQFQFYLKFCQLFSELVQIMSEDKMLEEYYVLCFLS